MMTSSLWQHLCLEPTFSQCSIFPSSFLLQLASVKQYASYEKKNKFTKETYLNVKHWRFVNSTYSPNLNIYPIACQSDHMRINCCYRCIGRRRSKHHGIRSFLDIDTFSTISKLLHQTCTATIVKYLSRYTGRISDWMTFALSSFAHRKQITQRCSLRDAFNGNAAILNVYKRGHSDVIIIILTAGTQN